MASVSTFLNFPRETEAAFAFYKEVFNGTYLGEINRIGAGEDVDPNDTNLVAHVTLQITSGYLLHGADAPESMGFNVKMGNNSYIMLELDTRKEADDLFAALKDGGNIITPLELQPWGMYYGACADKFGVQWIFNAA